MLKQNLVENREKKDRADSRVKTQNKQALNNAINEKEF